MRRQLKNAETCFPGDNAAFVEGLICQFNGIEMGEFERGHRTSVTFISTGVIDCTRNFVNL